METDALLIYTRSFKRLKATKGKDNLHSHLKNLKDNTTIINNGNNNNKNINI